MKNNLSALLLSLVALGLLTGIASAQNSSRIVQTQEKNQTYLPSDLGDKIDDVQTRDDDPPPPPRRRPRPRTRPESEPQPTYNPMPARACYTNFFACPMMIALPQGSSCNCFGPQGRFPGIAQ